jgi:hypothetical protein
MTQYTEQQYEENYPPGIEQHFWHSARNAIIARTLSRTEMADSFLLEIGCGTGVVVSYLRRRGMRCIGCDLANFPVVDELRGVVFAITDFRDLPAGTRKSISGVLLCDVIEHLPDPTSFLFDVRNTFPALRRVLITVPARQELWSSWDNHYGHYRRYDRSTLCADLDRSGFRVLSAQYFFHTLYIPMYLMRRRRPTRIEAPRWVLPHLLIGAGLRLEHVLIPAWIPGTSLIAVASPNIDLPRDGAPMPEMPSLD